MKNGINSKGNYHIYIRDELKYKTCMLKKKKSGVPPYMAVNTIGNVYTKFNPVVGDTDQPSVQVYYNALKEATGQESLLMMMYWLLVKLNLMAPINNE